MGTLFWEGIMKIRISHFLIGLFSLVLSMQGHTKDIGGGIDETWNASNNTWVYRNTRTGRVMTTACMFRNGKTCLAKRQRVVNLLFNDRNSGASNLFQADMQDAGRQVQSDFREAGRQIQSDARAVGRDVSRGAEAVGRGVARGADAVDRTIRKGIENTQEALTVRQFTVKANGIDHTMTFKCMGQHEGGARFSTKECQEEYAETLEAIKSGSTADTLAEHRIQSDPIARTVASGVGAVKEEVQRWGHNSCRQKLERHARDFDQDYADQGLQHLVSYEDKMSYIQEQLIAETAPNGRTYYEVCHDHFKNAVFGMQLTWIGGEESYRAEETSIFNGLGRLASGDVGKFNSERRVGNRHYKDATDVFEALSMQSN